MPGKSKPKKNRTQSPLHLGAYDFLDARPFENPFRDGTVESTLYEIGKMQCAATEAEICRPDFNDLIRLQEKLLGHKPAYVPNPPRRRKNAAHQIKEA